MSEPDTWSSTGENISFPFLFIFLNFLALAKSLTGAYAASLTIIVISDPE